MTVSAKSGAEFSYPSRRWIRGAGTYACAYLFLTAISYFLSPFSGAEINGYVVLLYSFLVWSFFAAGERLSAGSGGRRWTPGERPAKWVFLLSVYVICIIYVTLSSSGWLNSVDDVILKILSPGESYFSKFEVADEMASTVSTAGQIYTILMVLVAILIPIGVYCWPKLNFVSRFVFVVAVCFRLLPGLVTGTMVDVALVFVELGVAFLFLIATGRVRKEIVKRLKVSIVLFAAMFVFFGSYAQISRVEYMGFAPWISGGSVNYDPDNFLSYIIGGKAAYGFHALLFYANHGYEGLAQCLVIDDFKWTYGIGHSRALMEYAEQYLGWSWIWNDHVMWRNQLITGRDPLMYWSTALPWFAADVTFYGVPFVLLAFGILFGRTWREAICDNNPLALALFTRLVIFVLFLPANNQVFQSRAMWWSTVELLALYFASKLPIFRGQRLLR